ncbi:MAG: M23 family metallopeptidase [Prevotellaceae bacterium]|jgi:murein DD-endopeptidase MepM/ murein hydrolase activator NlpD|nr:M23 family metallopeptidase [Prevotellaceae bacterium]
MKKYRYRYQHEHLDFVKIKVSFRDIALKVLLYVFAAAFITISYYIVFSLFFDTPEERGLKREKELLETEGAQLQTRYEQIETIMKELNVRDKEIYRTIFHTDPAFLNSSGNLNTYDDYDVIGNDALTAETVFKMRHLQKRAAGVSSLFDELSQHLKEKSTDDLLSIPLIQPIENRHLIRIGASYGKRMHPFYKLLKEHTGTDFIAGVGADVFATANGKVASVQSQRSYGRKVEIDHGNGYTTVYAHLSSVLVKQGQPVKRGQVIAKVGNSGMSVVPHLHYEVLKHGQFMDPLHYFFIGLMPDEYEYLIQFSTSSGQPLD